LEPSAHIETHEPPPPNTRPLLPAFENSLVSAINLAASTSQLSTVNPLLLSSDALPIIQHSSPTADQLMTELRSDSLGELDTASFLPDSAMALTEDETPHEQQRESCTTGGYAVGPSLEINDSPSDDVDDNNDDYTMQEATGVEIQPASAENDESDMNIMSQKVVKSRTPELPAPKHQRP
jgi:hypothetical protein